MSFDYEIPYFWVHVGPPDMPEPGFYEDPMSLRPYGIKLEKMWRNVGFNWSGERALVDWPHLAHPESCETFGHEEPTARISMRLNIYQPNNAVKKGNDVALLIRGHSDERSMNGGGEHIQQLYIPRSRCTHLERWSPDEWEDDDSDPVVAVFTFEADFQSIRYMDSELEDEAWDKQIEEDAMSGRLDELAEKSRADVQAGRYIDL